MPRVLAVADADSYLKWCAATLDALPADWVGDLWVLDSPIAPSPTQQRAATHREPAAGSLLRLLRRLRADPPDVLLLGCTGPVVQAVLSVPPGLLGWAPRTRPVLVSGLPGISVPASERAVRLRDGVDLLLVHSHREQRDFAALAAATGSGMQIGLARLPFLHDDPAPGGPDVVFAAQAKVPADADDRRRILQALADVPRPYRAVVKLRGAGGERQTHDEAHPYPALWADLAARQEVPGSTVRFAVGPMRDALEDAAGFVTVSSTAALEAIGRNVPVLVLDDFGVSGDLINEVFAGSGCLGNLDDLAAARFRRPEPTWAAENYFHPPAESDWVVRLDSLLAARAGAGLPVPRHRPFGRAPRRARWAVRLLVPRRRVRSGR